MRIGNDGYMLRPLFRLAPRPAEAEEDGSSCDLLNDERMRRILSN